MRAAYFRRHGGPDVMEVGEAPEPVPAHGTVIVEVRAVALNHLDLWVRRGLPGLTLRLPHIGGSDVAGVIRDVAAGVDGWSAGDRVVINPSLWCGECAYCRRGEHPLCTTFQILGEHVPGGAAELVRVPARNVHAMPPNLDFPAAAAVPLAWQTAWRALTTRGRLQAGDTLLVTGASGGVATAAIQIAASLGARVMAVTSGAENAARVRGLGAECVIDRLSENVVEGVKEATAGAGVDVVLDSVGEAMWPDLLRCLGRSGRLVTYGATTGARVGLDVRHVFWKQLQVIGSTMASRDEFEAVLEHVSEGRFQPIVDAVWPLGQIRQAHERLEAGAVFGKLVLTP